MKRFFTAALAVVAILQTSAFAKAENESTRDVPVDTLKVEKWIGKHAIAIDLAGPDQGLKGFRKIEPILRNKRIIGLGDATHGTKEFFVLKHRMIEYMVKNMGCTAVALELPLDYGVKINDYVQTGEGDIDKLLESVWWWHQAEEIKNFFIWLKDYNMSVPDDKKVYFFGFDSQVRGDNTYQIFKYLKKVDEHYAENIKPVYDFMVEMYIDNYSAFTPYRMQKFDEAMANLNNIMEANEEKYTANSSREEYLLVKARVNTFTGAYEMQKNDLKYSETRAKANLENLKILSEMQDKDGKIVVWAHNGHITSDRYVMQEFFNFGIDGFYDMNTMGAENLEGCMLKEFFGDQYFAVGFEFCSGGFTAIKFQKGIQEFAVEAPERGTLPYVLNEAKTGSDCYFIALENSMMDKDASRYFNSVQFCHEIGAAYISRYVKKVPSSSFNAIVFVRTTSPAVLPE